jgi:hypothetical protein
MRVECGNLKNAKENAINVSLVMNQSLLILFHEIKILNLLLFHDYFEFQINN